MERSGLLREPETLSFDIPCLRRRIGIDVRANVRQSIVNSPLSRKPQHNKQPGVGNGSACLPAISIGNISHARPGCARPGSGWGKFPRTFWISWTDRWAWPDNEKGRLRNASRPDACGSWQSPIQSNRMADFGLAVLAVLWHLHRAGKRRTHRRTGYSNFESTSSRFRAWDGAATTQSESGLRLS